MGRELPLPGGGARVMRLVVWVSLIVALVLSGCQPSTPRPTQSADAPATDAPQVSRTLIMVTRLEPVSLATKPLQQAGTLLASTRRVYNATLALLDDRGAPLPYLAEALPQ